MQTVGILFSSAEINSIAMSQVMVTELEKAGYTSVLCGIASEMDIEPAVSSAIRKVDVLLAPTDNIIANSIALIADIVQKAQKPLIVSDNLLVRYGALMARGVDYYESGKQAGEIAQQVIIQKTKPHEIGIMQSDNKEIYINKNVLDSLAYNISDRISGDVILVN
jgi:putative ABC transport system substrate-binding protein